jgi:hypothetical protein
MDNATLVGSDAYGIGREFKIGAADISKIGGTGGLIILGDLPEGTIMNFVRIRINQQVAGTGTITCTVLVKTVDLTTPPPAVPADVNTYGAAFNVAQAPTVAANPQTTQPTSANMEPLGKKTALAALIGGTNLQNVNAGSVSVFARYTVIASAPPLRFDTTAQTPRAMPAY